MFFVLLADLLYLATMLWITYLFLSPKHRRQVRQGVKYVWVALKMLGAVALSPVLVAMFFLLPKLFLPVFTFLWPHLDVLGADETLYLRRFFMTPKTQWFRPRFLHLIARSDEGRDSHDHPGPFTTTILHGGYEEWVFYPRQAQESTTRIALPGTTLHNPEGHTHMVKLFAPTWTWVIGWRRGRKWGFWLLNNSDPFKDRWVESEEYGAKGVEVSSWEIRS